MSTLDREACAYAALYCEENVWQLAQRPDLAPGERHAVFVSNRSKSVAMWGQRASELAKPVVWDYHVFLAVQDDLRTLIYDLDARADFPCAAEAYLQAAFPFPDRVPESLQPTFRIVAAERLLSTFASDRGHMLDEAGMYRAKPPPWPLIRPPGAPASNLMRFVDMADDIAGIRRDLSGLRQWCAPSDVGLST